MSAELITVAGLLVTLGALVQGAVGYGMSLVAAPLLALIDPVLVPVPMLILVSAHSGLSVVRELSEAGWRDVGWAMLGRLPGSAVGVLAVVALSQRVFSAVIALAVLACVVLSNVSWRPRPTRRALVVAGAASGVTGTAAAIGGPPVALLYQHAPGPRVRATLGAYFLLGAALSLGGLAAAGEVTVRTLTVTGLLAPFLLVGFLLSGPARRILDRGWTRTAVLTVATISALLLLVRAVVG